MIKYDFIIISSKNIYNDIIKNYIYILKFSRCAAHLVKKSYKKKAI